MRSGDLKLSRLRLPRRAVAAIAAGALCCGVAALAYSELSDAGLLPQPVARTPAETPSNTRPPRNVAEAARRVQPIRIGPEKADALAGTAGALHAAATGTRLNVNVAPIQLPRRIDDLQKIAAPDPDLVAWLATWGAGVKAGQGASPDQLDRLRAVLKASPLPCRTLVELGNAVQFYSGDNLTGVFFAAAAVKGDHELAAFAVGSEQAKPLLRTMKSMWGVLWRLVDDDHDRSYAGTIILIDRDLLRWVSPTDTEFSDALQDSKIGMAECVYLNGTPDEAIAAAMGIDATGMTRDQLTGVAWIRGLAFMRADRAAEAVPQLQIVVDNTEFKYTEDACRRLFFVLQTSDRLDEAERVSALYTKRYGWNAISRQMSATLEAAKVGREAAAKSAG